MASGLRRFLKEELLFYVFLLALFLTVTTLVLVVLAGRSRRDSLSLEYDAQRIASALIESLQGDRSVDMEALEQRVVGFGIYTARGTPLRHYGSAPSLLEVPNKLTDRGSLQSAVLRLNESRKTITLVRWIGMFPGMTEMHRRAPRMMQPLIERMNPEGLQLLYLELNVEDYWVGRRFNKTASILSPLLILVVMGFVGYLYRKNSLYRKKLVSQAQLAHLGEISRTLSHEIKNPLSAIRIQTGILAKTLPEQSREDLKIIEEEVSRLSLLTDRIGDFLRDPLGRPELIDLDAFTREIILRFERQIRYVNESEETIKVAFDRQRLRSVLENLINNALESEENRTASAGNTPGVEIEISADKHKVQLVVLDRGEGIPEKMTEKIFDPFYTSKINGSGVGLSICKRFVEAVGGELKLENRKEGGTAARIILNRGSR
jgi:two-component system sensor histidine kinase HydH